MRKAILYIAMSLDGKIANEHGGVEWLEEIPSLEGEDYGYQDFFNSVDAVVMGNTTYKQICSFELPYPYADKQSYVFSRQTKVSSDAKITFVNEDLNIYLTSLKKQEGKTIWILGGGEINGACLRHHLIDEVICFVMPVVLGKGPSLFGDFSLKQSLQLSSVRSIANGVVELRYVV